MRRKPAGIKIRLIAGEICVNLKIYSFKTNKAIQVDAIPVIIKGLIRLRRGLDRSQFWENG